MHILISISLMSISAALAIAAQAPAAAPQAAPPAKPFAYALALEAAQAALTACQATPAVVEVMDTAYNPKIILVADNSRPNFVDFARRKAYTVIKKGMSSGEFGTSVGPQGRGAPPIEGDANLITFAGALPIKVGDEVVAALSVSGPGGQAADEVCAKAGLDKIRDRLK